MKIENIWQVVSQKQTFFIDLKRYHIIVVLVVGKLYIIRVEVLWYVYNYIGLTTKKNKQLKKTLKYTNQLQTALLKIMYYACRFTLKWIVCPLYSRRDKACKQQIVHK